MEKYVKETNKCGVDGEKEEPPIEVFQFDLINHQEDSELEVNVGINDEFKLSSDGKCHCDECEYTTNHRKHMQTHKLSVHDKLQYECDECKQEFSDTRKLSMKR